MRDEKIDPVEHPVVDLPRGRAREQRMSRAIQARRRLRSRQGGGRAWINGREVGGPDPRYKHLAQIND